MPRVAYKDSALTVWRGKDCLRLIDGLTTNQVLDLEKGQVRQTVFTTTAAKIIDFVTVFHMGDFLAVHSHASKLSELLDHVIQRILGQDVSITDVSSKNVYCIEYGVVNEIVGTFSASNGLTRGNIGPELSILIAALGFEFDEMRSEEEFSQWRVENTIPWNGYEISSVHHPLAAGLAAFVHPAKGSYIGQEILARMVSRGRQGKKLMRVETTSTEPGSITTLGEEYSLAILRTTQ